MSLVGDDFVNDDMFSNFCWAPTVGGTICPLLFLLPTYLLASKKRGDQFLVNQPWVTLLFWKMIHYYMLATSRWKKGISRNWPNVAHTHVCVSRAQYVISWPQSSLEMPGYIQKAPPNSFNKSFLRNTSGSCLFTRVKMQTKLLSHVTNNIQYCICCWWVRARSLSKISRFTLYSRLR